MPATVDWESGTQYSRPLRESLSRVTAESCYLIFELSAADLSLGIGRLHFLGRSYDSLPDLKPTMAVTA